MSLLIAAHFSNRGNKLEMFFSTLIFERYVDFIRASAENPVDSACLQQQIE